MKFKAKFGSALELSKLLLTLDKLAATCLVHLKPDMLQFGVVSEGKDNLNLQVSADISQSSVFLEYAVSSKAEDNRISFFVKIENLSRALKSCCSTKTESPVQVKLTKKQGQAVLSFEIHESAVDVLHEVPIRVVSDPRETLQYDDPEDPKDAAVAVVFPSKEFRGLKNVVERMRTVSELLQLTTSRGARQHDAGAGTADDGDTAEFQLLVEKPELVKIKTTYPRLGVPITVTSDSTAGGASQPATASAIPASSPQTATALVEVKKLLRVLQSLCSSDLKIQNAIVCISPNEMVILKIYLPDVVTDIRQHSYMIYYIPTMADPDD